MQTASTPSTYVAMLAREGDAFVVHSDHPAVGSLRWDDLSALERSVRAAIDRLPDDIQVHYAAGVQAALVASDKDDLAADNPDSAYETVPGSERLPAAEAHESADGSLVQQELDQSAAERIRERRNNDRSIRPVGIGNVTATD